jgi:hypothetical protein
MAMLTTSRMRCSKTSGAYLVGGAGGTGSALLPNLARLHHAMLEVGHLDGIKCIVCSTTTR